MRIKPIKLDIYIFTEFIGPFFGGVVFFLFVFLMLQVLRLAEFFIVHGVALPMLGKMAALLIVSFLPNALPIAFLIAVLISFGRLSSDSELVAMKANGVSIHRMTVPIVASSLLVVIFSLYLNLDWVPFCETEFKRTSLRVGSTKVVTTIKEGTFTSGFFDLLIFADKVDTNNNRLTHVFLFDEREAKNPLTVVAGTGEIVSVKPNTEMGAAAMLKLWDGNIHRNNLEESTYQKIDFSEYRLYLSIEEGGDQTMIKPRMIRYNDLMDLIQKHDKSSFEGREFRGEFWRRIAIAIAPIIFVFLGVGFGTVRTRAVRAGAALIALLILVFYWATQTVASIAILRGILNPAVAMLLPNFLLCLLAVFAYRKATW